MSSLSSYVKRVTSFSRNCRLFIASNSVLGFGISSAEVFLGLYFIALGFREDFIGTYYAVSTGTSAALLLMMGKLSDRIGRVASLHVTLLGHLAGYCLLFACQSVPSIMACGFLNGAAAALRACTSSPFLHENARPAERDYVFSASSGYMLLGNTLGSVIGGYMPILLVWAFPAMSVNDGYRYSLVFSAALILVSALPVLRIDTGRAPAAGVAAAENGPPARALHPPAGGFTKPEGGYYHKFVIYTFLIGCGAGLIVPFFNVYFAQKFSLGSGEIGIVFMVGNILTALLMMVTPAVSNRLGKIRSIALMEVLSLPFLIILGFSGSLHLCLAAFFVRGALMNMNNPVFMNVVMEMTPGSDRGRISSLVTLGDNFSRTISTYVSGKVMTDHGVGLPYVLTAVFYTAAAAYVYRSFARYEKKS